MIELQNEIRKEREMSDKDNSSGKGLGAYREIGMRPDGSAASRSWDGQTDYEKMHRLMGNVEGMQMFMNSEAALTSIAISLKRIADFVIGTPYIQPKTEPVPMRIKVKNREELKQLEHVLRAILDQQGEER